MALGLNFRGLREHHIVYWLLALVSIVGGMSLSHHFDEKQTWIETRYRVYRLLTRVSPNPRKPKQTVLVTIDDAEYWTGPLERRVPIKRDYLATVIKALDACDPAVIAIDFDLRSPTSDGSIVDNPTYQQRETPLFIQAISEVSQHHPVVLPVLIRHQRPKDPFLLDSSVFGTLPFVQGKLQRGYINLPFDVRKIPAPQPLVGGGEVDSFAVSIVRAHHENLLESVASSNILPFGTFLEKSIPTVKTTDVLAGRCGPLASKIAIVAAAWHKYAANEGELVDLHITPLGMMTGATIHANYVEALIDSDTHKPLPTAMDRGIEFLTAAAFAILLAAKTNRGYQKLCIVVLACLALLLLSYLAWQNLGYYFDFFFPVFFLIAHALAHYLLELWRDSKELHNLTL